MAPLRCDNLTKSLGSVRVLNAINLDFQSSGIVAIIGPNGAGKTTLINVLTGFMKPDNGRCFLGERDITNLSPHQRVRLGIARTFQDLRLALQISVLENVLLAFPNQRGETLFGALFRAGVAKEEDRNLKKAMDLLRDVGIAEKAVELAGNLSYGQQKLLSFACSIATGARILFFDEPVAGVHPGMISHIQNLLRQFSKEHKLIVFTEHDISVVRQAADHVVVMAEGKIIAQGRPQAVLERPEIMEVYLA